MLPGYVLHDRLDAGDGTTVWRAEQVGRPGRVLAVKLVPREVVRDNLRPWRRQVEVLQQARVPGVLTPLEVIDTATREVVHTISFEIAGMPPEAIQPVGVRLTKDGSLAFVALGPSNRVAVIDQKTYEVEDYLLVGQRVWQLAFNADQSRLYTTNGISNDISVIDVNELEVIKSITAGEQPWGVAVAP